MNEPINQQNLKPEDLEMEIGGAPRLEPKSITEPKSFTVNYANAVNTDYGKRIDFVISDDYDFYTLSSWNIVSRKGYKVNDFIGKKIIVSPYTEKKLKVALV